LNQTAKKAFLLAFVIVLVDQLSKIWVKLNMLYNESIPVFGSWFYIHFIENPGMAYGLELGGSTGKLALTFFRIALVGFGIYYISKLLKKQTAKGAIYTIALILAGAVGNIIDSVFYGKFFSTSTAFEAATFLPEDGGYAPWFMGKVVDMFYFPIIETTLPAWVPLYGGEYFVFFRPVFNVADSAITTGIIVLMLFNKKWFPQDEEGDKKEKEAINN